MVEITGALPLLTSEESRPFSLNRGNSATRSGAYIRRQTIVFRNQL